MRILFLNDLNDPRIGSSVRQMYQEAERLRELGHDTTVASTTPKREDVGWTEIAGCRVFRIYSNYPMRFRPWVALNHRPVVGELRKVLAEVKPDVVHSHLVHTHLSYAALRAARDAGAGVVFTAHDSMTFCYQKLDCFHGGAEHAYELKDYRARAGKCVPCQRFRFRPGRNRVIRRVLDENVDRFTVVTDELGRAIGANGIRVDRTIHNAIRMQAKRPAEADVVRFQERFGLRGKQVVALGGRLHELKGVSQVFRALALLREDLPDIRLLVLGRKEIYDGFRPGAQRHGVDDLVVSTGWLEGEELASAMATIDVMLTPSICFETFGMMNLEAMELETPVVATSFGGCPEVVTDGVTGLVVNPFDVPALAERIARLLRDPELRQRYGAAGRKRLVEHFNIERLTDEFLEEYALARGMAAARAANG